MPPFTPITYSGKGRVYRETAVREGLGTRLPFTPITYSGKGWVYRETAAYPVVSVVKVVLPLFGHEGEVVPTLGVQER